MDSDDKLEGTLLGKLLELVSSLGDDYVAGLAGNRSAARRVRVSLQELSKYRMSLRKELLAAMKDTKKDD